MLCLQRMERLAASAGGGNIVTTKSWASMDDDTETLQRLNVILKVRPAAFTDWQPTCSCRVWVHISIVHIPVHQHTQCCSVHGQSSKIGSSVVRLQLGICQALQS